jgi:transcriptional regulator with XRE-family HTH domain
MITNERQRRVAVGEKTRFEHAIARARTEGPGTDVHPALHDAMIDGMSSQLADLDDELRSYDALRAGRVKGRVLRSFGELADVLIEGRIAARLTQKQLAQRIGVSEQQVQRYEQSRYSAASLERLQIVAEALKLTVGKSIGYHVAGDASGRRAARRRTTKGAVMAGRVTGKRAASSAGKTLRSSSAGKQAKRAAASDLAQVGNRKTTGKKAASAAGKTLRAKGSSRAAKTAAASDLSQAARSKKR